MQVDSRLFWIWLQKALGYGNGQLSVLLNAFPSPEEIYAADQNALRQCGISGTMLSRLCDKSLEIPRATLDSVLKNGDWLLTPADEAYPSLLRGIYAPPAVLYGRGNLPDFSAAPAVAVVGTRSLSRYGLEVTTMLAGGLARGGALVISGGADGGDAAAMTAAMENGGRVVSVQACGLDINYPAVNEALRRRLLQQGGTLLTEYPYGTRVQKGTFHVRNRLLSGMAHGVCVTEAPLGSGALITANFAREQGRDVFAVPGALDAPNSAGSNQLIKNGAKLVRGAEEILEEYQLLFPHVTDLAAAQPKGRAKPPRTAKKEAAPSLPPVSDNARAVLQVLGVDPMPADEIAAVAKQSVSQVLAALTELEMVGLAAAEAGQQYRRT